MSNSTTIWRSSRTFNALISLVLAAIAFRAMGTSFSQEYPSRWIAAGLLTLFTLLLLLSYWPRLNARINPALYFIIQAAFTLALLSLRPFLDFYAVLFGILSVQTIQVYPRVAGFQWIAAFSLLAGIALVIGMGWLDGLPLFLLYTALFIILAYLVTLKDQAERAQQESEFLLKELRKAHAQLQEQAAQAEELAIMKERNRLARDLHDSVTQALYSQTLYAEAAARQLTDGDIREASSHVREMRQTAQQALQEMRLLIFELRPPALQEAGLVSALQTRLESVEGRVGLKTDLRVQGDIRLSSKVEEGIYWICQEALNNVLKHASAQEVSITLRQDENQFSLQIVDDGVGFDPVNGHPPGMGLRGMSERAEQVSGQMTVTSEPGAGVCLRVEVPL
jgi:signal transduction histidine kinase